MVKKPILTREEILLGIKRMQNNQCPKWGAKMINVYDSKMKEISPYLWQCPKGCMKNIIMSKG